MVQRLFESVIFVAGSSADWPAVGAAVNSSRQGVVRVVQGSANELSFTQCWKAQDGIERNGTTSEPAMVSSSRNAAGSRLGAGSRTVSMRKAERFPDRGQCRYVK